MKKKYNKSALKLAILFAGILLMEFLFAEFLGEWSFREGALIIGNRILCCLALLGSVYCLLLFFKPGFAISIALGILFLLPLALISYFEINPIDTTTQPVDVKTVRVDKDGKKRVVRQYKNAKTNATIIDTVLVKDVFLFRRVYD